MWHSEYMARKCSFGDEIQTATAQYLQTKSMWLRLQFHFQQGVMPTY